MTYGHDLKCVDPEWVREGVTTTPTQQHNCVYLGNTITDAYNGQRHIRHATLTDKTSDAMVTAEVIRQDQPIEKLTS